MTVRVINGDCRSILPTLNAGSFDCIVTSPPYWGLRDYGAVGQIGLEPTLDAYVGTLAALGDELWRVLKPEGTFWLNLGDSYTGGSAGSKNAPQTKGSAENPEQWAVLRKGAPAGLKMKDLCGVPWRVAFALQARGWWLRSAIVWAKPNPMPESVTDRPTSAYEMVFLLTKAERYFYDADAIAEPNLTGECKGGDINYRPGTNGNQRKDLGRTQADIRSTRNARNVWTIATQPFKGSHFATMPPDLAERCIKAGTSEKGCCPHCGKPWERVVERESRPNAPSCNGKYDGVGKHRTVSGGVSNDARERVDRGWQPTCDCREIACLTCNYVLALSHEDREAITSEIVSDVWDDVPTVEERREVLLAPLLRHSSEHDPEEDMPSLFGRVPANIDGADILQPAMREEGDRKAQTEFQGRSDIEQPRLCDAVDARASECASVGLCDGASRRDGAEDGTPASARRGSASHKWIDHGQRSGEPGSSRQNGPRSEEKANIHGDLPALSEAISDARQCPCCRGRLVLRPPNPEPAKVLDCFGGAGTTGLVADRLGRNATLIELNPAYRDMGENRVRDDAPLFWQAAE